jgi:hypothetical protein
MIYAVVALVLALVCDVWTSNAYPFQEKFRQMKANVDCHNSPAPLSFHVHVTYMLTNDDQIQEVSAFRDRAQAHFAPMLGSDPICQGTEIEPSGRYGEFIN